jgi:AcrR family transcriptional regulator
VPKRSDEHLEARRQQILDGARRAFARYGYEGATVVRLEQETGLSRGAIFNYFPSKWEIFFALAQRDAEQAAQLWVEQGWEAVVRWVASVQSEWLGVYFELNRRLRTDAEARERWMRERAPETQARIAELVAEAQARGELRSDLTVEQLGRFLGVVLDGIVSQTAFGERLDPEPIVTLVRDAIAPK